MIKEIISELVVAVICGAQAGITFTAFYSIGMLALTYWWN